MVLEGGSSMFGWVGGGGVRPGVSISVSGWICSSGTGRVSLVLSICSVSSKRSRISFSAAYGV